MKIQIKVRPPFGPEIVSVVDDISDDQYEEIVNLLQSPGSYDYFVVETTEGPVYIRGDTTNNCIYSIVHVKETD